MNQGGQQQQQQLPAGSGAGNNGNPAMAGTGGNSMAGAPPSQQQQQQQPQTQPQQQQQQQQQHPMYRPEQMRNIKELSAAEKAKYENGLRSLWKTFNESPEGSTEKDNARRKILDFAPVLARKVRERRAMAAHQLQQLQQKQQQQQQQQAQGQAPGQPTQQQIQQAQQAQVQAQGQAQQQARMGSGSPNAAMTPSGPQQHDGQGQAGVQQKPMLQAQATQGQQQGQPPQQRVVPNSIQQHLNQLTYLPIPSIANKSPDVIAKWQEDVKKKLGYSLLQIENARANRARLETLLRSRSENNQLSPEARRNIEEKMEQCQKAHDDATRFIASYRKQQEIAKQQQQQRQQQQAQQQQAGGGVATAPNQQQPQQAGATQQPQGGGVKTEQTNLQHSQANINGAIEAAKKESLAAAARQGVNANNGMANNGGPALGQGKPAAGPAQQTPIPPPVIPAAAMQQQQKQQQQQQQQHHPHQQPQKTPIQTPVPPPAPINTAMAAASRAAGAGAGTPTPASATGRVATPHSAASLNAAPRALSHQKALEEANKQRAASIGSGPVPTTPGGSNVQPIAPAAGGSAAGLPQQQQIQAHLQHQQQLANMQQHQQQQQQQQQQHAQQQLPQQHAQQQHPQLPQHQQQGSFGAPASAGGYPELRLPQRMTEKLPMPKQLSEKATQMPQPVAVGGGVAPGRPTMTGGSGSVGGVMGQPAVAKVPMIQMEGEGERVLNKKKLDELVRQVCGGTAEGQEGNLLQPDVEESVLNLADSFVDSVLHTACRNAKERGSKVLEIRDIQLVLERTYNIRIPGYSSDELRTVRKVQPSMQWITKMSVIQAAKVTSGSKNDA